MTEEKDPFATPVPDAGTSRSVKPSREDLLRTDDALPQDDAAGDDDDKVAELIAEQPGMLATEEDMFDEGDPDDEEPAGDADSGNQPSRRQTGSPTI